VLGGAEMDVMTEDQVRDYANSILEFKDTETAKAGVGQITTFNQLGFKGVNDKPDGWYLPNNTSFPAIILETKAAKHQLKENHVNELIKNCEIVKTKYKNVIGILYNGIEIRVFKENKEIPTQPMLQNKEYYLSFFENSKIDKNMIYTLTKKINDTLHFDFGVKNLYHRMVFTACTLVAKRYGATLHKGMNFKTFQMSIQSTLHESFQAEVRQRNKLNVLLEVYGEIKMNSSGDQSSIDKFIDWVSEISDSINSDYWNGEDVMAIFFNEFTRYKGKSEKGQVFTPDHITSFMYKLLEVNMVDSILDAACGSGSFLVKSMCNMIKQAGGLSTNTAKKIKESQLYGIEFDREIFALACANMLIHKDGKTNLEQLDSRKAEAIKWIRSLSFNEDTSLRKHHITKVLMNPPFENKYGCLDIVENVLNNVKNGIDCAFILPDNKLEKNKNKASRILSKHRLIKIIKLPENIFSGVTTSVFVFKSGEAQNDNKIFACYIQDDGFETVKNQGRHDVKDRWNDLEDIWIDIIYRRSGDSSIQWLDPNENLSFVVADEKFDIKDNDFRKVILDYVLYNYNIDAKLFKEKVSNKLLYYFDCEFTPNETKILNVLDKYRESSRKNTLPELNIDTWKPFTIEALICPQKISKPEKRTYASYEEGETPFVASGNYNNGVVGFVQVKEGESVDAGNCITVSAVDGSSFYQKKDFLGRGGGGSSINIIRHEQINEFIGVFLSTVIGKVCSKYKFADMCSAAALKKEVLYLPVKENEPDWDFMESYVKSVPLFELVSNKI